MAYQRWGKPGRMYVWAGDDGLHIWPPGCHDKEGGVVLTNDQAGRDNAAAIARGCVDLLISLGMVVHSRRGGIVIEKKK